MNKKNIKKVLKKVAKPEATKSSSAKTASKPAASAKPAHGKAVVAKKPAQPQKAVPTKAGQSKNVQHKAAAHAAAKPVAGAVKSNNKPKAPIAHDTKVAKKTTDVQHAKTTDESHAVKKGSEANHKGLANSHKEVKSETTEIDVAHDLSSLKGVSRNQLVSEANKLLKAQKGPKKVEEEDSKSKIKAQKAKKRETEADDEDLIGESDDFGADELSEYEAELVDEELAEDDLVVEAAAELTADVIEEEIVKPADEEIVLTDAEGRRYCRVRDCDQAAMVDTYCRYHYLLLWKKIQVRKKILADGKLERYVDELTSRYPDKFLEVIRKDLRSEKDFLAAIQELEIDESSGENEFEEENTNFIDEVRGAASEGIADEEEF